MARCIISGISTSLISTTETSTPHGTAWRAMDCCRSSLRSARWARRVSRSARPTTERRVVWANCEVATAWFSTAITDLIGSDTLNMTTALTRAVTLSRVMTSWGGMVSVTTRRSTGTSVSSSGSRITIPGPSAPRRRPRRKATTRSYSRTTRRENTASTITAMLPTMARINPLAILIGLPSVRGVAGAPARDRLGDGAAIGQVLLQRPEPDPFRDGRSAAQMGPQGQRGQDDHERDRQQEQLGDPALDGESGGQRPRCGQHRDGTGDTSVESRGLRGRPHVDQAAHLPAVVGARAAVLDRTGVADRGAPAVSHHPVVRIVGLRPQPLVLGALPGVVILVVREPRGLLLLVGGLGAPGEPVDAVGDQQQQDPVPCGDPHHRLQLDHDSPSPASARSEERRVGKEGRSARS